MYFCIPLARTPSIYIYPHLLRLRIQRAIRWDLRSGDSEASNKD